MHIDFVPPSNGTYNNAGTSRQLANYLEHEDLERMEKGIYTEGFFNLIDDNIYKSTVIITVPLFHSFHNIFILKFNCFSFIFLSLMYHLNLTAMNNYKLIASIAFLLICFQVKAQDSPFRFGVKAGATVSNALIGDGGKKGTSLRVGYQMGVTIDYEINETYSILSGLSFITKGSKIESLGYKHYINETSYSLYKYEEQYLQIPFLAAYTLNLIPDLNLIFAVCPYFAYGIGGNSKLLSDDETGGNGSIEYTFKTFKKEKEPPYPYYLKPFDFGAAVQISLQYKLLFVNAGYDQGIINISGTDIFQYRNYSFLFSVGLKY